LPGSLTELDGAAGAARRGRSPQPADRSTGRAHRRDRGLPLERAGIAEPLQILRLLAYPLPPQLSAVNTAARDHGWPVAEIDSVSELAEHLELSEGELAWLADVRGLERIVTEPTRGLQGEQFQGLVAKIAREQGFAVNQGKSVLTTAAGRQSVGGVVVNARPNIARTEYDRLKAILYNVARRGPERENRSGVADFEAHLRGRIAWVAALNPDRGERLLRRFAAIDWKRPPGGA
jgi:hypothetical protein